VTDIVLKPDDSILAVKDPNPKNSALAEALLEAIKKAQNVKEDENGKERS